jgi:hypothetical protein
MSKAEWFTPTVSGASDLSFFIYLLGKWSCVTESLADATLGTAFMMELGGYRILAGSMSMDDSGWVTSSSSKTYDRLIFFFPMHSLALIWGIT